MENTQLRYKLYFFVPYNISPIQQGIQSGHVLGRYCLEHGKNDPNNIIWDFLDKWETFVILNGGDTNNDPDPEYRGGLQKILDQIKEIGIPFATFYEPSLNNALTSICFLADERVWDYKKYPNFLDYLLTLSEEEGRQYYPSDAYMKSKLRNSSYEELTNLTVWKELAEKWMRECIGGEQNMRLRELIKDKKTA